MQDKYHIHRQIQFLISTIMKYLHNVQYIHYTYYMHHILYECIYVHEYINSHLENQIILLAIGCKKRQLSMVVII